MLGMCKKFCGKEECAECYEKSFASVEKSKLWCYEHNPEKPYEILKGSHTKVCFYCEICKHHYERKLGNVTYLDYGCPYCAIPSKILCSNEQCKRCFERSFASHPKSKKWSEKNISKPRDILKNSNKKYWFNCSKCNHDFEQVLNSSTEKSCVYCSSKKLCENENCKWCFNNSFASQPKSKWWSSKNTFSPRQITKCSGKKCFFDCPDCFHTFEIQIDNISKGFFCPYCSSKTSALCGDKNCKLCFERSFASSEYVGKWSSKNKIKPIEVASGSNKKYWFECDNCGHDYESRVDHVRKGIGCPYCCTPVKKLCMDKECKNCRSRSFACPETMLWSSKNTIDIGKVTRSSGIKYIFVCKKCKGEFKSDPRHLSQGRGCSKCKNKTESKFLEWVAALHPDVVHQYREKWCVSNITNRLLPFDFFIPSLHLIIEIDGPQHFRQIGNWDAPQYTQSKDLYKMKKAYDQGISVIRIPYEYIFYDEKFEAWKDIVSRKLIPIDKPEIIYVCDDDRYHHFRKYDFDTDDIPEIISEKDAVIE